ncbi:uncharacterized protein [Nicotiana sylvestris]|uniref:uncharacterized protein n=1 Tax=Nicotiana sylvestris TaxID=4096 RepID=UPI00388CDF61
METEQSSINLGVWHQRLGHLPMEVIKRISKLKQHFKKDSSEVACLDCPVCPLARQTKLLFPVSTSRAQDPFHLLHVDVWGPYRVSTHDNKRFFLTIVDDFSRITWLFFMNAKDETYWLPSTVLKGKSPYEKLFNTEPSIDHMRVFECLCYAVKVRRQDKFSARALSVVFMGYSPTKKGYKLYDLQSKQFIISRDVAFKEHVSDIVPEATNVFIDASPLPVDKYVDVAPQLQHDSSHLQAMDNALPIAVRKPPKTTHPPKCLSPSYTKCLSPQSSVVEPKHYHGASKDEKWRGSTLVFILFYVDDLLIIGNDAQLIQSARDNLQKKFKMKYLGELKLFLGIEFTRRKAGILMNQRKYTIDLIDDFGLGGAKPVSTLLECNQRLIITKFDEDVLCSDDTTDARVKDCVLLDPEPYQRLVGMLLYLTMTRLDIAYIVQVLSQFIHKPKMSHMDVALRVIKYVKNASGLGLLISSHQSDNLVAFCDSDWASCPQSRKLVTGIRLCIVLDSPAEYADEIIVRTDMRYGSSYDERLRLGMVGGNLSEITPARIVVFCWLPTDNRCYKRICKNLNMMQIPFGP